MSTTSKKTVTRSPSAPVRRTRRSSEQTVTAAPTTEQIAALAYRYFEESGYAPGHDVEHWLRAESELQGR